MEWVFKIWNVLTDLFKPSSGNNSVKFSNDGDVKNVKINYDQRVYHNQPSNSSDTFTVNEDQDFQNKKVKADHLMSLVLLPSISFGLFFLFISGYISWNSAWKTPLIIITCFIFFNKIKYHTDRLIHQYAIKFSKLTFLNTFLISQFSIDLTREDHFPKIKNLVMLGLFLIIQVIMLIAIILLIFNFSFPIQFPTNK